MVPRANPRPGTFKRACPVRDGQGMRIGGVRYEEVQGVILFDGQFGIWMTGTGMWELTHGGTGRYIGTRSSQNRAIALAERLVEIDLPWDAKTKKDWYARARKDLLAKANDEIRG